MPGQIEFYYNESNQMIEVISTVTSPGYVGTTDYVWDQRYIDAPVMSFNTSEMPGYSDATTKYYYTQDANYDVTAAVGGDTGVVSGRAVYTPYGQRTVLGADWTGSGDVGELGHQGLMLLDDTGETGLYYNRARMYHPTLGRFLQRDPLVTMQQGAVATGLMVSSLLASQLAIGSWESSDGGVGRYVDGMNLYEYVRSRAGNAMDALGLACACITAAGAPNAPPPARVPTHKEILNGAIVVTTATGTCGVIPSTPKTPVCDALCVAHACTVTTEWQASIWYNYPPRLWGVPPFSIGWTRKWNGSNCFGSIWVI